MKSFRDMLDIWKCNCYPAAAGLTVLLTAVGVAWNCERGLQVNLLLPALAVAMLVCGLFFSCAVSAAACFLLPDRRFLCRLFGDALYGERGRPDTPVRNFRQGLFG